MTFRKSCSMASKLTRWKKTTATEKKKKKTRQPSKNACEGRRHYVHISKSQNAFIDLCTIPFRRHVSVWLKCEHISICILINDPVQQIMNNYIYLRYDLDTLTSNRNLKSTRHYGHLNDKFVSKTGLFRAKLFFVQSIFFSFKYHAN